MRLHRFQVAKPPTLYRVSRLVARIGVVVAIVIVAYIALTIYSASQIRVGSGGGTPSATVSQNIVNVTSGVQIDNGGFLSITDVSITSVVRYPDGSLLGVARSPTLTISPGANVTVPITITVPLSSSSQALVLLTHSVHLPTNTSANVTFGGLLTITVNDNSGFDWGAPFDSLNATAGTPTPQANGTVAVPIQITYTNRASFGEFGQLTYTVSSASGTPCASGSLPISVPSHQNFNQGITLFLSPSCSPSGGTIALAFSGAGLSLSLPPERIP